MNITAPVATWRWWYTVRAYPPGTTIASGTYNFTFWYTAPGTFMLQVQFGHARTNGLARVALATAIKTFPGSATPRKDFITFTRGTVTLPSPHTRIFYLRFRAMFGPIGIRIFFNNPDRSPPTRFILPPITEPVVEFPFGAIPLLLPPVLIYNLLRRPPKIKRGELKWGAWPRCSSRSRC